MKKKSASKVESAQRYDELYGSYKQVVLGSLVKKGFSADLAEEIVQEAFVRLLSLEESKVPSYLKSYLYRITHNLAVDHIRKAKSSPYVPTGSDDHIGAVQDNYQQTSSAEELARQKQTAKSIKQSIEELPDDCQRAFYFYKINGLSYEEIATLLKVSPSMVRKHVLRAIRHCFEKLELDHD